MKTFNDKIKELETLIEHSYESGVSLEEAERLAGRFLHAALQVSTELKNLDLDARMKRTSVKAIKAAVYLAEVQKNEKKPSDVLLNALVDTSDLVAGEQRRADASEADRDELERVYNVVTAAHHHFKQIAKGNFNG